MDPILLKRPWRLLATRWPWTSTAYLLAVTTAGWVGLVAAATVVWLPGWAMVWARAERQLVTLTGLPTIPTQTPAKLTWREALHAAGTVVAAVLGTIAGAAALALLCATLFAPITLRVTGHVAIAGLHVTTPGEQVLAVAVGLGVTAILLWLATAVAQALGRLSHLLLGPDPKQLQHQVTTLSAAALHAQDSLLLERRALERELHDGAQLHLAAAAMSLGLLELDLAALPADTRARLQAGLHEVRNQLDAGIDAVRSAAHTLVPRRLVDEGLGAALEDLAATVPLDVTVDHALPRLSEPVEQGLYLITTEAVTNALKHASAQHLTLRCRQQPDGGITLTVSDDGMGSADLNGSGILGMQARAATIDATLAISSPPGGPTTLTVHRPAG